MSEEALRIALVGASTLLGKALSDELAASTFASADLRLLDEEDSEGQLAEVDGEIALIQSIDPDSFDGCDFIFFAGNPSLTRKHIRRAIQSGACIVDLSGELDKAPELLVRAPWIAEQLMDLEVSQAAASNKVAPLDLETRAVISAHPVAVLLAMLAVRSQRIAPLHGIWATLLQPASEYGHAALEELQQQTSDLLSFRPLRTEVFGGQAAFALAVSFEAKGQTALTGTTEKIRRHYSKIVLDAAGSLALQVIQVPVFHGYALSAALEFDRPIAPAALAGALAGPYVRIVTNPDEFPNNVQAVEEEDAQILLQPVLPVSDAEHVDRPGTTSRSESVEKSAMSNRFWLWIIADNLKFAAMNAVACAVELDRLRPRGKVQ